MGAVYKLCEYLDYNKPIDPKVFATELPKDVVTIDRIKTAARHWKGTTHEDEIATKVAREFFEALIAKDYEKAGLIYGGFPAEKMKGYGRFDFSRIVRSENLRRAYIPIRPHSVQSRWPVGRENGLKSIHCRSDLRIMKPQWRKFGSSSMRLSTIIKPAARQILDAGDVFEGLSKSNSDKVKIFEHYKVLRIIEIGRPSPYRGAKAGSSRCR